ncbi:hypothetical protein A2U01_0065569, partial [Trifolium medium]|nr:hypothetical protein [Trifolium medium]
QLGEHQARRRRQPCHPGAAGCCAQLGEFQARRSTLFTGLTFVDF